MKITDVQTYPVFDGNRNVLFVVIDTDEGLSGVGEAGLTWQELAVAGALEPFTPLLVGEDPGRLDLGIVGGLSEAKTIAGWCATHCLKLAPHHPLGPVSPAAWLPRTLATSTVGVQEQPQQPGTRGTAVVPVPVPWEQGYLLPPTRPGPGIVFDRAAATQHPYQPQAAPRWRREDGAFTNW